MAVPNQFKKETAELLLSSPGTPPDPNIKPSKTARTQLPAPVAAAPDPSGLKQETLAVSDMPDSPAAEMEKDRASYRHARRYCTGSFDSGGACREKFNAADVDPARRFCSDFDYSDLDLPFLKPWKILLLSSLMNPILTAN